MIYLTTLLIIGLNVPYNNKTLLGGGSGAGTSPFVIMAKLAGLNGLDHLVGPLHAKVCAGYPMLNCGHDLQLNITVCISVLSIGLSCVYAGSRVLTALAETGFAPRCFQYVDKSGRPLYSVLVLLAAGPIGQSIW